jgi:hypothetical protein
MGFQVSPGVVVTEKDLTTIVPSVSTTDGAFVGAFTWGPLNEIVLVGDENLLVKKFGKPDNNTATSFFTAANFLAYGDKLRLVRVAEETVAKNATANGSGLLIKNDDHYEANFANGQASSGNWAAKYVGTLGNSLKVSICPSPEAFSKTMTGTYAGSLGGTTLVGTGAAPENEIIVGSIIKHAASNQERTVTAINPSTDTITIDSPLTVAISGGTLTARWEYADVFGIAPGTSSVVSAAGGTRDELHVVVVDEDGTISGIKGTVLEKYAFLSKASNAKSADGTSIYYVDAVNRNSQYVRWLDHQEATTWGSAVGAVDFLPLVGNATQLPKTDSLGGGVNGNDTTTTEFLSKRLLGYDLFKNAEEVDVALVLLGEANAATVNYVVGNICEERLDCVAFFSPEKADVVNNSGNEVVDTIAFKNSLNLSTSYAVMDNNWKYQYDKYNDTFRWIPLNGDIAGICVRTDVNQDPWWSPAGYNRGLIKNVVKLAYSPYKAERDDLYLNSINPVISTPGQGTLLFGDKTLQSKPSAFDRINVRRLFIVLEKAISRAAKYMLFEFNDEFTRQQFRNLVEPFLRDVQGRRGIYDFKVVCDRSNNTAEVIDRNEFVGDIYIKPARAINFIQLNFIAVRTGVDFSEIVGKA